MRAAVSAVVSSGVSSGEQLVALSSESLGHSGKLSDSGCDINEQGPAKRRRLVDDGSDKV